MLRRLAFRTENALIRRTLSAVAEKEKNLPTTSSLKEIEKIDIPATDIYKPPHYRKIKQTIKKIDHILADEFPNQGDKTGAGARLWDYYNTAKIIEGLPTIAEKIDFASPYERDWVRSEKTWHREWLAPLSSPRKAWRLPDVPHYFDCLEFYKFITKTCIEEQSLDNVYTPLNPPTAQFQKLLLEHFAATEETSHFDSEEEKISAKIAGFIDCGILSMVHNNPKLADYRVVYNTKSESFWVRAGFEWLYDEYDLVKETVYRKLPREISKYIGDDRRYLGELAFVHRDIVAAQMRSINPLKSLFELESPEARKQLNVIGDVEYSPKVYNLWPDTDPLWQCPGFLVDSNESHRESRLIVKSMSNFTKQLSSWAINNDSDEYFTTEAECYKAQAITTLFTSLCAQAHTSGFTQFNDITRPFTGQLVLCDGHRIAFAFGQLNTLAFNIQCDGFVNPRTNFIQFEGPFDLFASAEQNENMQRNSKTKRFNDKPLSRILQMLLF